MNLEDTIQNDPNGFGQKIKSGIIEAKNYISKHYNTTRAIATVTATSLLMGCVDPFSWCPEPDPTPNPDPIVIIEDPVEEPIVDPIIDDPVVDDPVVDPSEEPIEEPVTDPEDPLDTTAPIITFNGSSSVEKFLGDEYQGPTVTATDDVDGDITDSVQIAYIDNFGRDENGQEAPGPYTVKYTATDSSGNVAEKNVTVENKIESSELENLLNMQTTMTKDGEKMTVKEAMESLGLYRVQGTNAPNIEGEYSSTGDWLENGEIVYHWDPFDMSYANQNMSSIDVNENSGYPSAILTGNGNEFSIYYSEDLNEDGTPDKAYIEIGEKMPTGNLEKDKIIFYLNETFAYGREYNQARETNIPKD